MERTGTLSHAPPWLRAVARAAFYGVSAAVMTLALAIVLSGSSVRERQQTNENVRLLVSESHKNRQALCIAVIRNPANVARNDPRLMAICAEVGVMP